MNVWVICPDQSTDKMVLRASTRLSNPYGTANLGCMNGNLLDGSHGIGRLAIRTVNIAQNKSNPDAAGNTTVRPSSDVRWLRGRHGPRAALAAWCLSGPDVRHDLEGIVAKWRGGSYTIGPRTSDRRFAIPTLALGRTVAICSRRGLITPIDVRRSGRPQLRSHDDTPCERFHAPSDGDVIHE